MIPVGLRIDVDTLRGTRIGVPRLNALLSRHNIAASYFFSVGPDNMGRNLWRLFRPTFLAKMLRTQATGLYGWDILLRGTAWPGPVIGKRCPEILRETAAAGHEIGLHAWDHHRWQMRLEKMDAAAIKRDLQKGVNMLTDILGGPPRSFAAPAWRVTPAALAALELFPFHFQADCRGTTLFHPCIDGRTFNHVQVPTTLPTYDELIGRNCTAQTYNASLLDLILPDRLNILTIHAEVEGIVCLELFQDFLAQAEQRGMHFQPLGEMLSRHSEIQTAGIVPMTVAGRDGWLACQEQID